MLRRNTRRNTERRSRSPYADGTQAALITGLVMGALWILLFKEPVVFGNNDVIWGAFYFALLFPGVLIALPSMLAHGHNVWSGWMVIGATLNWLLYSWLVYALIHFRRRKREAGLPPSPEPEPSSYTDRWQKPAS